MWKTVLGLSGNFPEILDYCEVVSARMFDCKQKMHKEINDLFIWWCLKSIQRGKTEINYEGVERIYVIFYQPTRQFKNLNEQTTTPDSFVKGFSDITNYIFKEL